MPELERKNDQSRERAFCEEPSRLLITKKEPVSFCLMFQGITQYALCTEPEVVGAGVHILMVGKKE